MLTPTRTGRFAGIAATVLLATTIGCQTGGLKPNLNPFPATAEETPPVAEQPVRMAVIWKETAVAPAGRAATRGFGGRVYFYNELNEPIRADGELTVYAFDDSRNDAERSNVPDRKYVFHASDLDKHFGETELGPSYSVWLPWDKVGGLRKTVALMPVFKPTEGRIVQSDQSIAVLPGKTIDNQIEDLDSASLVRQVNVTVPPGERDRVSRLGGGESSRGKTAGRSRTTTIRVPRSMASRMRQAERTAPLRTPLATTGSAGGSNSRDERVARSPDTEPSATEPPKRKAFGQPGSYR